MLEYCPKGNLRSYLIDHEKEFKTSLKYYHEKGCTVESIDPEEIVVHDVRLLCIWACQVDYCFLYYHQSGLSIETFLCTKLDI